MASSSSSFLLAAVALAALFAAGSCGTPVIFMLGGQTSPTRLCLEPNVAISKISVKPKGAKDFTADLKEVAPQTFVIEFKEPIEGPISVRWGAKAGGYDVADDVIPAGFKAGDQINTGKQLK